MSEANAERDLALLSKAKMIEDQCVVVKEAERAARITERQRLSIDGHRFKSKNTELSSKISELLKRVHSAEKKEREAIRQAKQSTQRSKDIMTVTDCFKAKIAQLESELSSYQKAFSDLDSLLQETSFCLSVADEAVPVKEISKTRDGRGGTSSCPLYIWELIIEQLVNGTPPTSVNSNIVAMVKLFSPTTKIKELPSIWTIRRARTVLLVLVQTLATYRIAKADKWEQLFTDGTSRRQVAFQDLVISIEEDELFK